MQFRNEEYNFSLIKFSLNKNISAKETSILAESTKKILRRTDILTYTSIKAIWIMLPNTKLNGAEIAIEKIKQAGPVQQLIDAKKVRFNHFYSKDLGDIKNAKEKLATM